jgi:hypothetical protein
MRFSFCNYSKYNLTIIATIVVAVTDVKFEQAQSRGTGEFVVRTITIVLLQCIVCCASRTHPIAANFIAAIVTILLSITEVRLIDTLSTCVALLKPRGTHTCSTIVLVTPVLTVFSTVAHPFGKQTVETTTRSTFEVWLQLLETFVVHIY